MNTKHIFILTVVASALFASAPLHAANPRATVSLKNILAKKYECTDARFSKLPQSKADNEKADDEERLYYPVFLEIAESEDATAVLDSLEAVVYHSRANIYLTSIPIEKLDRLIDTPIVNNYQVATSLTGNLDVARKCARVDDVHASLSTIDNVDKPDGHAVVTGMCDLGFDPRHAAFKNSLKRWVMYDEYHGVRQVWDGYNNIVANAPATDDTTMTHATHVANIIAGRQVGSPYYGVAPATDFVATTSQLSEVGICSGIEDVIAFAKETGRPAVVNISAGTYLGPHDGTDLVGRYLSAMAEDAVICFSAGNYGQRANCQVLDLDKYSDPVGSAWCDSGWCGLEVQGGTDLWGRDNTPFEFRLVVWDVELREYKYIGDWTGGLSEDGEEFLDLSETPWFTEGGVWAAWGTDEHNNRYNVALQYDYKSEYMQTAGPWARYAVGYHVRRVAPGTHVDVYADGIVSFLHGFGIPGCQRGISDGTASNMSSCPDVVCIGAWNSRAVVPDLVTGTRDWGHDAQIIAPWSAYGTTGDGRTLPHFAAPGNTVVSALSTPHSLTEGSKDDADYVAYELDGYKYFATAGTSMSSPFAAGTFALWLSVYPQLGVHDLRDIAVETARRDFIDIDDPRWGAGALDAFAGLEKVRKRLEDDSVEDITIGDNSAPVVMFNGYSFNAVWAGVANPVITVYDLTGRQLANSGLPTGRFYIVKVLDAEAKETHIFKVKP